MNKLPDRFSVEIPSVLCYIPLEQNVGPFDQIKADGEGRIYSIRTHDKKREISRGDTVIIRKTITAEAVCPDKEVVWEQGDKAEVLAIVRPFQDGRYTDILLVQRTSDQTIGFLDPQEVQ